MEKPIMDISDYKKKYGKITHKCESCGKHYRLPSFIFSPRDKICFTCEVNKKVMSVVNSSLKIK